MTLQAASGGVDPGAGLPNGAPSRAAPAELARKLATVRDVLDRHGLAAIRLRGTSWFAWATCGGSNGIVLASERGVADILVTAGGAWVLTDVIEAQRLAAEELPGGLEIVCFPWGRQAEWDAFARDAAGGGDIGSDLPEGGDRQMPAELVRTRRSLQAEEIERYRHVGRAAAEAMTEALSGVSPEQTELELAGAGAAALLRRGLDPALVLVAGSRRVASYRHPPPTTEKIGDRAEVVFCARGHGLYANLTRFVYFREPTSEERRLDAAVARVEAAALGASLPGATLAGVFAAITREYARLGFGGAELDHHQGGLTGYATREVIATPEVDATIDAPAAVAWNPSLPGAKIEDTVLVTDGGLETLTFDPAWPTVAVEGRPRPDLLVRR